MATSGFTDKGSPENLIAKYRCAHSISEVLLGAPVMTSVSRIHYDLIEFLHQESKLEERKVFQTFINRKNGGKGSVFYIQENTIYLSTIYQPAQNINFLSTNNITISVHYLTVLGSGAASCQLPAAR